MHRQITLENLEKIDLKLPTLPGIAIRLLEIVETDRPDIKKAVEIISVDAPLSAKVLKTVNSPLYGLRNKISSVNRATVLLGTNTVKNLAMSFSLIANFHPQRGSSFTYAQFWKDSLLGAVAARAIATGLKMEYPEEAFFCGLLQNIGSLILAESFPKKYEDVSKEMHHASASVQAAESQIIGLNHSRVGEYAVRKWGLPDFFGAPILFHHDPDLFENRSAKESTLTQILHLSSLFIDLFNSRDKVQPMTGIATYVDRCDYTSLIEPTKITQKISAEVKSIFPIFEIEVDESEHLRIIESAKSTLFDVSTELGVKVRTQAQKIERLKLHSTTDGLTKLYNQRHFIQILTHEIERAHRHQTALSLIMADIDDFKKVNDFYGHLAGDHALKIIATTLKETLRGTDYLARYGGEEFAAILPLTSSSEALQVAERLRAAVRVTPISYNGKKLSVTMSFGIASMDVDSGIDMEGFIHMADEALYEAKHGGRDRCCAYRQATTGKTRPTILIVDDEDVVLVTVSRMLERMGYGVIAAKKSSEALNLIDRHANEINAIILDVIMPEANPQEILAKLRQANRDVRVFLSSGYTSDHLDKNLMASCDGFLAKPYTFDELSEKLQDVGAREPLAN